MDRQQNSSTGWLDWFWRLPGIAWLIERLRKKKRLGPVEHVIVLMLENRSFDHMLGFLPGSGGLVGTEFNRVEPADPESEKAFVNREALYTTSQDPSHDFDSVQQQLYGAETSSSDPASMSGFVWVNIRAEKGDIEAGKRIMDCFDPVKLPALSTLAKEFCLCDHWFSSIPGPTWPNRFFVHAASSDGTVGNDVLHPFLMKTIYNSLEEHGNSWRIYFHDIPHSLVLRRLWGSLDHFKEFHEFLEDVERGRLPNYSFIEPRYLDFLQWKASDQHPPHDVKKGEYLIAEIYDALRRSSLWEKCLFIVLYDEHGGYYDHVPPPRGVPNPDGKTSANPPFDFSRLGVRVPAVLVSPWIEKGIVEATIYEHASVPATIKRLFGLPGFLNSRDRSSNTFDKVLTRKTPRMDTPERLPVPGDPAVAAADRVWIRTGSTLPASPALMEQGTASQSPLSEFQVTLVELASLIRSESEGPQSIQPTQINTEHEAALQIQESMRQLLK